MELKYFKFDNSHFSGKYVLLYAAFSNKEGAKKEWEGLLTEWKAKKELYDSVVAEHKTAWNEFQAWMNKNKKLFEFSNQRISALKTEILRVKMYMPSQPYMAVEYQDKNGKLQSARHFPRHMPNPKTFDEIFEICEYSNKRQEEQEKSENETTIKAIKYCVEHNINFTVETAYQNANHHAFTEWEKENPCPDDYYDEDEEREFYFVSEGNFINGFYWQREC
jgi:hypothetical protein